MTIAFILIITYTFFSFLVSLIICLKVFSLSNKKRSISYSNNIHINIIIPLFKEEKILKEMYGRFKGIIAQYENINLYYVTTEREYLENNLGTTPEFLEEIIQSENSPKIHHIHYPKYNKVVAEQINYAIKFIVDKNGYIPNSYVCIYNADSVINENTINTFLEKVDQIKDNDVLFQQSSLFLSNISNLITDKKFLLAAFGVYQSFWTIRHEIPQYILDEFLKNRNLNNKYNLVYCVTHGLFMPLKAFQILHSVPDLLIGGEDLALGYYSKASGFSIYPLLILENSATPDNYKSLITQLTNWYLATLGYLTFWKKLNGKGLLFQNIILTIQGVFLHPFKWLFRGVIIISFLCLSIYFNKLIYFLIVYLFYVYLPILPVIFLWKSLDPVLFPKVSKKDAILVLIFYFFVPILRSIPAFFGLVLYIKICFGYKFVKGKT